MAKFQIPEQLREVDPRTVSRDTLVKRGSVHLNLNARHKKQLRDHIRQIRNPYCYLGRGIVLKLSFQTQSSTIEEQVNTCT